MATAHATELPWSGDPDADRLIAADANALMIGFVLDQQVTVQQAFLGPLRLKQRLGHLDPARIAATDPSTLEAAFRERPAIHRYPGSMAGRVQALCAAIAADYGGDASLIWTGAADAADLRRRLVALPGIGDMKVRSIIVTVVKQLGVKPDGWRGEMPAHPTLGDCGTPEQLAEYQAAKRAHKATMRAARPRS
ncbi:MAG TPA: HhH-GPD-type base excision DNA repair protein [Gaiellales bacterium]|nr:HhH-GPD-type base excision DNA repair protein [Gaiellales bacterium]